MPIFSIGIICSKLLEKAKLILTMLSGVFGIFGAYLANASAREWIHSVADGFVYSVMKNGGEISEVPRNISFATSDGYFAAIGQFVDIHSVEVLRDGENAGFKMRTMPSGIYGAFYEGMGSIGDTRLKIKPFDAITCGSAEVWCCGEKKAVELEVQDIMNIRCTLCEECENSDELYGAMIIQDGKLAATVSGKGEEKNVFTCISAEQAADLGRMIYEQRILEAVNAEE